MKRLSALIFLVLCASPALADWRDDSGYTQLAARYGAAIPTGSGVTVLHCEAETSAATPPQIWGAYLPQSMSASPFQGTSPFSASQTFYAQSGLAPGSGHAATVGSIFYAPSGVSPNVSQVQCYEADDFINQLYNAYPPPAFVGAVQNHSYIGTTGDNDQDAQIIRAYDAMVLQQSTVLCVPLNNGSSTTVPPLPSSTYNSVCVGLVSGNHSQGGTLVDTAGRMKPDVVVNQPETSYACPSVASTAVILGQALQAQSSSANTPVLIKALIVAGASKYHMPQWQRASSAAPYDAVFGAGELNVLNSYQICIAGHASSSNTAAVSATGWDQATAQASSPQWYYFSVPKGSYANTFSAGLTWFRALSYDPVNGYAPTMAQMGLSLYAASGFTVSGAPIAQSFSTLDNVQHVFLWNLPPGQYALQVTTNTTTPYALAWQAQIGNGPALTLSWSNGQPTVQASQVDPYATYSIQKSTDLQTWSTAATLSTSTTTPATTFTWQDSATAAASGFYRLQWTSVRP